MNPNTNPPPLKENSALPSPMIPHFSHFPRPPPPPCSMRRRASWNNVGLTLFTLSLANPNHQTSRCGQMRGSMVNLKKEKKFKKNFFLSFTT